MAVLRVLSGGAAQGLVERVRGAFESDTRHRIDGCFGAVGGMRARVLAGEPVDVLILTRALIDELVHAGHVAPDTVRDIGAVPTAIAVREGDPFPEIGDAAALRAALLDADAIHVPDPQQATAGIHFDKVLRQLGVRDRLDARLRPAPNGATAMRMLATDGGRRPLGCTQATEIIATPGVALAGPLPEGCSLSTVYAGAVAASARAPDAARRLLALLTDDRDSAMRRRLGFAG
jgi:molybdate transport system substrate-binding protein